MSWIRALTLHEAAEKLGREEVSSRELTEELLTVIRNTDATVHAYVHVDEEDARSQAEAADRRRSQGRELGRFDGVPLAVKDNLSVRGQPVTCASRILQAYTSPYDATVIDRLRQAGFLFVGRTNMDEFAMGSSTEHSAFGPTANPWDTERVPGGSSGGSAAAVAAGEALAALGSDTGGSVRQPAGFCGVTGVKPTYGRVSRYGLVAFASSLDQIGPVTKDVRDSALLMDLIAGRDPMDSTSLPDPLPDHESCVREPSVSGLRIGVPREFFQVNGLAQDVREAVEAAAQQFKRLGAELVDMNLPYTDYAVSTYYVIAPAEASANLARFDGIRYGRRAPEEQAETLLDTYRLSREQGFGPEVKRRILLGTYVLSSGYYDAYYLRAQKVRTLIRTAFADAFKSCDLMLAPVAPTTAYRRGEITDPLQMYLADIFTIPANLTGIPALSVPCAVSSQGLPVGLQLLGPHLGEPTLLRAAAAFEQAAPAVQCQRRRSEPAE